MPLDPVPRALPVRYRSYVWPTGATTQLAPRAQPLKLDLAALLDERQTRREFSKHLDEVALGELLWLACRSRSSRPSAFGPDQESRVHPSAGAMHPIHVLLAHETGPWLRYDPIAHALIELPDSSASAAACRDAASSLVAIAQGTLIGLVAESGKTAAKYEHHESLVWRDAGVVLGYLSVVAEAMGLPFCPLGITGTPYLTAQLPNASVLQAVGLAVVSGT
jgi:SagB-type dehydrogenase family enzyme